VQLHVFLLDHNDVEVVTPDRVFTLPPKYNQLSYQVSHVVCTVIYKYRPKC